MRESCHGEIRDALDLPEREWNNWYALQDWLTDLGWCRANAYILLVSQADLLFPADDDTLTAIFDNLARANEEWTEPTGYDPLGMPPTPFHVVLQCAADQLSALSQRLVDVEADFAVL